MTTAPHPDQPDQAAQDGILDQTFEELKLTGNLPSPSGVGMRILTLTQGDDYSTQEIAQTIQADPALTGRMLKLANSSVSGGAEPITTVAEATVRLGVRSVRNVALGLSLISANREGACQVFDYDGYWADSLARGVAAQALSRRSAVEVPAEVYVCGLLSNIGCLALASVYPEEYAELLVEAREKSLRAIADIERRRFAITHSEIASYMLHDWGLPQTCCRAVLTFEGEGERAEGAEPRPLRSLAEVLHGASVIARACCSRSDEEHPGWTQFKGDLEGLRRRLGMEAPAFYAFCNEIVAEWREWCALLTISAHGAVDFTFFLEHDDAPAAAQPDEVEAGVAEEPASGRLQLEFAPNVPLRVLAVDDDEMQLRLVDRYLKRLGAHMNVAKDGRQALFVALARTPQVVIADWMMPGMDGVELCRSLRRIKQGREMYFILLTGREEEEKIVEAFDAGVDDYIVKPFNPKLLLARIKAGMRVVELELERARDRAKLIKQGADLSRAKRRLHAMVRTDLLTELRNRRYAIERLTQEWSTCERSGKPLSVIMVDIDYFKRVNDTYGHDAGDVVLKQTARVLREEIRTGDDAVRMGGEEFLIICYGTRADQALVCAERVRRSVEARAIEGGSFRCNVTISLGIAERGPGMRTVDDLLKAADEAVYEAKRGGRNRACVRSDTGEARRSS